VAGAVALFVAVMVFRIMRDPYGGNLHGCHQPGGFHGAGRPARCHDIALAVGMQRMAGHGAIIRRLAAVETLGSTSVICADKTGTLTRNEMTVTAAWLPGGRLVEVSGAGYHPQGSFHERSRELDPASDPALISLLRAAALCNDAHLVPPDRDNERWRILGDPTEAALLTAACKAHIDLEVLAQDWRRQAEIPFGPSVG
jgi:Ca2+-transporting ATPase